VIQRVLFTGSSRRAGIIGMGESPPRHFVVDASWGGFEIVFDLWNLLLIFADSYRGRG
jgi:hypothetical protein